MSRTYSTAPYRVKVARAGTAAEILHLCHGSDICITDADDPTVWANGLCPAYLPRHLEQRSFCCGGLRSDFKRITYWKPDRAKKRQQLGRLVRAARHDDDDLDDDRLQWRPRRSTSSHWWC